jgi:hypothetical protein
MHACLQPTPFVTRCVPKLDELKRFLPTVRSAGVMYRARYRRRFRPVTADYSRPLLRLWLYP